MTLVDYLYITLAVLGVGRLLEKPKIKFYLGLVSSVVLVGFGILMIQSAFGQKAKDLILTEGGSDLFMSFLSAFLLTLSSPLTIVFWTGLFASKAIEKDYTQKQLIPFGVAAGGATFVFLGASVTILSLIRTSIPSILLIILNIVVGSILIMYGIFRLYQLMKNNQVLVS